MEKEFKIENLRYRYNLVKASEAKEKLFVLMKLFGPSVAAFIDNLKNVAIGDILEKEVIEAVSDLASSFSSAIKSILENLDIKTFNDLEETFVKNRVSVFDEEKAEWLLLTGPVMEERFQDDLYTEFAILGECLKAQYGNFFKRLTKAARSSAGK